MANNTIDLKFVADSTPIVQANKRLDAMGRTLEGLIKKQSAGAISDKQFAKSKKELRRSIDDLFPSWNKAKSAIDKFEKSVRSNSEALKAEKEALKKSKEETRAYVQSRKQAEEANRRLEAGLKKKEAAARQESATLERLRQKYDQGHAAMEAYSKELNDLAKAAKLGVISREQLTKATERLNTATKMGTVVSKNYGTVTQQTSKKLNQKSMILQQTGLQLGDLAVQVQSGTSFLLAFGQQATQLIGTFSLLARSTKMIALFSGLGVIVPIATAIAGSFLRMGGDAKTAADRVSELKDSLNAIKNIQAARMAGPTEMFSRFGANAEEAKELLDLQLAIELARSRRKISDSFGDVKSFAGGFVKDVIASRTQRDSSVGVNPQLYGQTVLLPDQLRELEGLFGINEDKARDLFAVLEQVFEAKTLEQQRDAGQALKSVLIETGAVYEKLSEEQDTFLSSFIENSITLLGIEKVKRDAAEKTFESEQKKLQAGEAALALTEQEAQVAKQSEAAKALFKSEDAALSRKKELLQLEIKFGEESTQVRDKIQEFERLEYAASLRKAGINQGFIRALVAQKEETQGLANEAQKVADETERLADASERVEKAFSNLRGFGESASIRVARLTAEVAALEEGRDPKLAGKIAEAQSRFDVAIRDAMQRSGDELYVAGIVQEQNPILGAEVALLKKKAELEEKLRKQEAAERKARQEAKKLGPAGPKLMGDAVKEFFKIGDFEKQIELERELLFVTEDRARVLRQFGLDFAERNPEIIAGLEEQIRATREIAQLGGVVQKSFEDGFISIVEGSKSVVGAFKDMARLIIKELFKVLVVQRAVGSFASGGQAGSGILGFLGGAFMSLGTGLNSSAMGGPLHSAGRSSGGTMRANMPYLVGERGPELVMPSHQGSIYNADLTGKAMGGSGKITQVFNFNLSANGDESVKKIVAQAAPQIADMAQKGVIAARRRGGTMRSTFG